MQWLPSLLKIKVKNLEDLENINFVSKSLFQTRLDLDIWESLSEKIDLTFKGNSSELKWKVMELIKVPIEELIYAYSEKNQKLYLLNKKIWEPKIRELEKKPTEIEKITLEGNSLHGIDLSEPVLNFSQTNTGLKILGVLCVAFCLLLLGLNLIFKDPDYQNLNQLKEETQNLKKTLNQMLETEKELDFQKEKNLLHKHWLKTFKNFPLQLPENVKIYEMSIDESGRLMQLKGETKNQSVLQNWGKQVPFFEMVQIQLQTSSNSAYLFTANIQPQTHE